MALTLPTVYPITDTRLAGLSHAEQVERLGAGGARLIQLREKQANCSDFFLAAAKAMSVARRTGTKIVINDRADVALAVEADGVHLGQDDMPPEAARALLGDTAIIGLSTHNLRQAIDAVRRPVDYIALGPIFPTDTKPDHDAVVGLDGLRLVREMIGDLPLVAIGGIDRERLPQVLAAGADSAAMIGALLSNAASITAAMREFSVLADHCR